MEDANCYLCDSTDRKLIFSIDEVDQYLSLVDPTLNRLIRHWFICTNCGFIYRSPVLDDSEISKLYQNYDKTVLTEEQEKNYFDRIMNLPLHESENQQKIEWLVTELKNSKVNSLLDRNIDVYDVGCGAGLLLKTYKNVQANTQLYGVELNQKYANIAIKNVTSNILTQEFKSNLFNKQFDLIFCTKVLEHVKYPREFIGELALELTQNGVLFLEVPDVKDFALLEKNDPRFSIPHIYYYSRNTLKAICAEFGLALISCRVYVTHRKRSYLQCMFVKHSSNKSSVPYDDWKIFLEKVRG